MKASKHKSIKAPTNIRDLERLSKLRFKGLILEGAWIHDKALTLLSLLITTNTSLKSLKLKITSNIKPYLKPAYWGNTNIFCRHVKNFYHNIRISSLIDLLAKIGESSSLKSVLIIIDLTSIRFLGNTANDQADINSLYYQFQEKITDLIKLNKFEFYFNLQDTHIPNDIILEAFTERQKLQKKILPLHISLNKNMVMSFHEEEWLRQSLQGHNIKTLNLNLHYYYNIPNLNSIFDNCTQLRNLEFTIYGLRQSDAAILADILKSNTTLRSLKISYTYFTEAPNELLYKILDNNKGLVKFKLNITHIAILSPSPPQAFKKPLINKNSALLSCKIKIFQSTMKREGSFRQKIQFTSKLESFKPKLFIDDKLILKRNKNLFQKKLAAMKGEAPGRYITHYELQLFIHQLRGHKYLKSYILYSNRQNLLTDLALTYKYRRTIMRPKYFYQNCVCKELPQFLTEDVWMKVFECLILSNEAWLPSNEANSNNLLSPITIVNTPPIERANMEFFISSLNKILCYLDNYKYQIISTISFTIIGGMIDDIERKLFPKISKVYRDMQPNLYKLINEINYAPLLIA